MKLLLEKEKWNEKDINHGWQAVRFLDSYDDVYFNVHFLLDEIIYKERGFHTHCYDYKSLSKKLKEGAKALEKLANDVAQLKELDSFSPDKLNKRHVYWPN